MSEPLFTSFSEKDLAQIEITVQGAERNTSGEIRVMITGNCDEDLRSVESTETRVYEQAIREFEKHGLHATRDKTGVLVLLVMNERKFQILADSGINARFSQEEWNDLSGQASSFFRNNEFTDGICFVVREIGNRLAQFFPRKPDDINELPDGVILGGGK